MKKATHLAIYFIVAVYCSSCCTIINGGRQEVPFRSKPPGATIFINDSAYGVTPKTMDLKRNIKDRRVKLVLNGYETYETRTSRQFDGLFFLNILLGGLIGMGVDALTGSCYSIEPSIIDVELKKVADK